MTKRFCVHGHNTEVTGRYVGGGCIECARTRKQEQYANPVTHSAILAQAREYERKRREDPEYNERKLEHGRARRLIPEVAKRQRENQRARLIIDCPPEPEPGAPCDLCSRTDRPLVADHDHETKRFRGWLCSGCNVGLGHLGDGGEGLRRALTYLEGPLWSR